VFVLTGVFNNDCSTPFETVITLSVAHGNNCSKNFSSELLTVITCRHNFRHNHSNSLSIFELLARLTSLPCNVVITGVEVNIPTMPERAPAKDQ